MYAPSEGRFGAIRLMGLRAGLWTRITTRKVSLCGGCIPVNVINHLGAKAMRVFRGRNCSVNLIDILILSEKYCGYGKK